MKRLILALAVFTAGCELLTPDEFTLGSSYGLSEGHFERGNLRWQNRFGDREWDGRSRSVIGFLTWHLSNPTAKVEEKLDKLTLEVVRSQNTAPSQPTPVVISAPAPVVIETEPSTSDSEPSDPVDPMSPEYLLAALGAAGAAVGGWFFRHTIGAAFGKMFGGKADNDGGMVGGTD